MHQEKSETETQNDQPQEVQVDVKKNITGRLVIGPAWNLPTPSILARVTAALRYFCVFLIGTVSGSDQFSGNQSKFICFCLSLVIGALGAVDVFTGVDPDKKRLAGTLILVGLFCSWLFM